MTMKQMTNMPPAGTKMVVVGGCGGMGRTLVEAALAAELSVTVLDLARSIDQSPPPAGVATIACDLSDEQSVVAAFERIAATWGSIDCLVNLAGYTGERITVENLSVKEWDEITDCCVRGVFIAARSAIPLLRKGRNASMVLIASTFAHLVSVRGFAPYAAAKAGVVSLGKALATECAPEIRVNVISPGLIQTPFLDGGTGRGPRASNLNPDKYALGVPLRRLGNPEEIAAPILFLASPSASYITGQVLHVNGGVWAP